MLNNYSYFMNKLLIFIITLLIPFVISLSTGEQTALNDMYNEWGTTLGWSNPPDCNSPGISCYNGNVIDVYVTNKFINNLIIKDH